MKTRSNRLNNGMVGIVEENLFRNTISQNKNYLTTNLSYTSPAIPVYTRPVQWLTLPSVTAGSQIVVGLHAVYDHDANYVAFRVRGNYSVDWGDGTSNTYADNTPAYKIYTSSTYAGLTSSIYENYKTLIITITPQAGSTLTSVNFLEKHNQPGLANGYGSGWLDIKMAGSLINTLAIGAETTAVVRHTLLEQFEFVGPSSLTTIAGMFYDCRGLKNVVSLDTRLVTGTRRAFYNTKLEKLPELDLSSCASLADAFTGMFQLKYVPELNTSNVSNFTSTFFDCYSLNSIAYLDTSNATNMSGMFQNCQSLRYLPPLNTSRVTNFNGMFNGCKSLINIPVLDTSKGINLDAMFAGCNSLTNTFTINGACCTSMAQLYQGCLVLKEASFVNTEKVTSFASTFNGCYSLKKITGLDTSSNTSFLFTFRDTFSLEEYPTLNSSNVTNFGGMFWQNRTLAKGLSLDTRKGTNFNQMFLNCISLNYVPPMTFGLTAAYDAAAFNSMFSGCYGLKELGTLDVSGVTTASTHASVYATMFQTCTALAKVGITGAQHNISFASCSLGPTALNSIYTNLAVVGASGSATKTITVTNNWGASAALGHLPSIAEAKGWQVAG